MISTQTTTNHYFRALVALLAALALAASLLVASAARPAYASDHLHGQFHGRHRSCHARRHLQQLHSEGGHPGGQRQRQPYGGRPDQLQHPRNRGAAPSPRTRSLPVITEPVVINGYSQPGSSANTLARGTNAKLLVQLSGTDAGPIVFGGLTVSASNSVVKGPGHQPLRQRVRHRLSTRRLSGPQLICRT